MLNAPRARRLVDSIEQIVAELAVRRIIDIHANKVTMVFAAVRRDSGWTAPRSSLAKRIRAALSFVGNAALIWGQATTSRPHRISPPRTEKQRRTRAGQRQPARGAVLRDPFAAPVAALAAEDFRRVLPAWTCEFYDADDHAAEPWSQPFVPTQVST